MGEKHFIWDEISDGLSLLGIQKVEDDPVKGYKKISDPVRASKIYCPHTYLILNFHETLSQSQRIKFRKHYLRKVPPNEPDVIILQDIKDLVMFTLATPVSPQFVNFFHLPIVDRFLRALIIYFQYYVTIWEELMQERAATMKKAPNPLAQGYRSRYADEMQSLRCLLGREYADLIASCQDTIQYHHMTAGKNGASTVTQSQGEKDLRMFEVLIGTSHRVVWIALQRKYFNLIEIELHRLLRTQAYNTAKRRGVTQIKQVMLKDDDQVLHGRNVQTKRKLLRNSPLIQELVYSDCDYRLLSLGIEDNDTNDRRILYLQNALLVEEDKLPELGIKLGILGQNRADYDVMLMPHELEKIDDSVTGQTFEKGKYQRRTSSFIQETNVVQSQKRDMFSTRLPLFDPTDKLAEVFPMKIIEISPKQRESVREKARTKWLVREIQRQNNKEQDTFSVATTD